MDQPSAINKHNQLLVDLFAKLVKQIKYEMDFTPSNTAKFKHSFRLKHIQNALKTIVAYPNKIIKSAELQELPGFGTGILARIDEILQTGQLKEIKLTLNYEKALEYMESLEDLLGIGRKKAYELVFKYNIKSIAELQQAHSKNQVTLPDMVVKALKYYNIYQQNIPRQEMLDIDNKIQTIIKTVDQELFGIICGSYRRQKMTSNDIDLLIVHPNIKTKHDLLTKTNYLLQLINKLTYEEFIIESITDTTVETRYMGFCRLNPKLAIRKMDIRYMPYESYYSALLYFTGSGSFNRNMRRNAITLGYKLSEYGIYQNNKKIPVKSEEELFEILGMEYIDPSKRL